ncbi:MAG: hypothetical protein GTO24_19795 [candidate division Zixibacteria bacterium]|nr:hypothetical protein [candidate division Zixibacteria bacterium]
MKVFRKLKVFALLFAVVALVSGFTVLNAPKTADASGPCDCWCMICMLEPPYWCWCECCPCGPLLP